MDRTVASSKSAGAPGFHRGHEDRSAEGVRIEAPKASRKWDIGAGVPLPNRLGSLGLGERRELPQWGPGGAPAANAFFAYLKPTEQAIKAQFFVKDHPIDRLGGMGAWPLVGTRV